LGLENAVFQAMLSYIKTNIGTDVEYLVIYATYMSCY